MEFISRESSLAFPRVSGLSDFEWRLLAWVCESPPLSINDLSSLLHRGVAQIGRTATKLSAAGLMRKAARGGGPGVLLTPSALGRTVYKLFVALARDANAATTHGLNKAELLTVERCLSVMTENPLKRLAAEQALARVQ